MFSFLIIIHILPSIKQLNVLKFKLFPTLNSKYYAYAHTISLSSLIFMFWFICIHMKLFQIYQYIKVIQIYYWTPKVSVWVCPCWWRGHKDPKHCFIVPDAKKSSRQRLLAGYWKQVRNRVYFRLWTMEVLSISLLWTWNFKFIRVKNHHLKGNMYFQT